MGVTNPGISSLSATVPTVLSVTNSPSTSGGTALDLAYSGTALPVVNGGTGDTTYTNGQILIGNTTGNTLTKGSITAGANITVTPGAGSITIAASSTAIPAWSYAAQTSTLNPAVLGTWNKCSGASFTITLPTAASVAGQGFVFQHAGTSLTQVYTFNTTSSQTIGGVASGSYALYTAGETLTLVSDGNNWLIEQHQTETDWISAGTTATPTATTAYVFTCSSANATVGAVYSNNSQTFIVTATIVAALSLNCGGTGTPSASGTLTKVSGTGDATITYSSKTVTGVPAKGTNTTDIAYWKRSGRNMRVRESYIGTGTGTAGTGDYLYFIPASQVADTTSFTLFTTVVGSGQAKSTNSIGKGTAYGNTDAGTLDILLYSSTYIRAYWTTSSVENMLSAGSNAGFAQISGHTFDYEIPITGWQP